MPLILATALAVGFSTPSVPTDVYLSVPQITFEVPVAHAEEPAPESIESLIGRIAQEVGISSTTLYSLALGESSLNPNAIGDHNCSFGLTQQNICANPSITKQQALDPEWSLRKAAKDIQNGDEYKYMVCNCWGYLKANYIPTLPHMADIVVNTSVPHKGDVAIFWYKDKETGQTVKHVAYVVDDKGTIAEANKTHCVIDTRTIHADDPFLAGYFDPRV